jgi:hypothetical protein
VLENMGMVFFDYDTHTFLNVLHEVCPEELIYEKNWRGYSYCEGYTEEQYKSTIDLCLYLCDEYGIEKDSFGYNVYHEETAKFNGIVTRSNFNKDDADLNSSFNFKQFMKDINGEVNN